IKDIESAFGCKLIDRLPKEAIPTKAGEILYSYARRIIALNNEAQTAISQFLGKVNGDLTIGGSTIPGTYILPIVIGGFKIKYPDVNISISIGDTQNIINDLLSGNIELGVVGAQSKDNKIIHLKLIDDKMQLIIPSHHKWSDQKAISLNMLLKEPFICREHGSGTLKSINDILAKENFDINNLNVSAHMGSTEAIKQAIKSGLGVSIFSTVAAMDELQAGTLKAIDITGLNLIRNFYLIKHKQRTPSPLSNIFENYLRDKYNIK
ncbi:MAG: LysR substrate-binding domain-containing protein, partial [Desulfobacterales bacterium]|nr:LysR substrate-binding domain-containing protein [Desulfobacterales bacterium]